MYIGQEQAMAFGDVFPLLSDETQGEIMAIARGALRTAGVECEIIGVCEDPILCISQETRAMLPGIMAARQAMMDVLRSKELPSAQQNTVNR